MITKEYMDSLKERHTHGNKQEQEAVMDELRHLLDTEDIDEFGDLLKAQIEETKRDIEQYIVRRQVEDILPAVSVAYIAKTYFHKSRAWLHQRINGSLVNGKPAEFTPEEKVIFNNALHDLGRRMMKVSIS